MENKEITISKIEKEQLTQLNSFQSFRLEEEHWRLKTRSLWLKSGDQNTLFFHWQYIARLSRNHISELASPDGTICKGLDQLKATA